METKILLKKLLLTVGTLGILLCLSLSYVLVKEANQLEGNLLSQVISLNFPSRIEIPSINVNARVEHVGMTPEGAMDVPVKPENAAWYKLGTIPGEIGSAVIDGHSGYKYQIPAVFDNLIKVKLGDKIYVKNAKGETLTFVVKKLQSYNPNASTEEVFLSSDGLAHLNLITCSGAWDPVAKTHSERLVVFADREI